MGNSFGNKGDLSLEQIADTAGAKLNVQFAAFGLSETMGKLVGNLAEDFRTKLVAAKAQHDLALQAKVAKDASRAELVNGLSQVCAVLYAPQSAVTDSQLASLGFAPRRSGSVRPKIAQRVTGLVAVPNGIDGVILTFDRALNPRSTTFQIFASGDQGATWAMVATSNRTRVTVPLAPGTPTAYRVVAQASGAPSLPSLPVSVYGATPPAEANPVVLKLKKGGKAA